MESQIWIGSADGTVSVYPSNSKDSSNRITQWSISSHKESRGVGKLIRVVSKSSGYSIWAVDMKSEITIWNQDFTRRESFKKEKWEGLGAIAQHQDGSVWVAALHTISIIDPDTLQVKSRISTLPEVRILALVQVNETIWSGASDGSIAVWASDGSPAHYTVLTAHSSRIYCMICNDSGQVWTGSFDKTIIVWDAESKLPREELSEHTDTVNGLAHFYHQVWSISLDNTLRCWC